MDAIELLEALTECREGKKCLEFFVAGPMLVIMDLTDRTKPFLVYNGSPLGFVSDFLANFNVKQGLQAKRYESSEKEIEKSEENAGC